MLIFHSFKASGSTFSRLHQGLLKSFKEAAISLRHLEKSILEGNLYLGPLEINSKELLENLILVINSKELSTVIKRLDITWISCESQHAWF